MAGLLHDTTLTDEQKEYLDSVRVSGEALLAIINDILDFSKIESGHMELELTGFEIHTLVQDTIDILAAHIYKKEIVLESFIEPSVPEYLNGDSSRIRQVLTNLVSNAIKFTEKGKISVKISVAKREDKDIFLLFEIIDTGIGITPEVRERLFHPFSQGDASTSRRYGGTGLGLAISSRLVTLMGGVLDVECMPEGGSKFWFTVHLTISDEPSAKVEFTLPTQFHGKRVLCLDKSETNSESFKNLLQLWHLRCDITNEPHDAIDKIRRAIGVGDPYILILMDYVTCGDRCIEWVKRFQDSSETPKVPIVILSALGALFERSDLNLYYITTCLTNPLKPARLFKLIEKVLETPRKTDVTVLLLADSEEQKKKFKILLVEDNTINQQVALQMMTRLGFRADAVGNGLEALYAIQSIRYDLILMDCQMPGMDGYTATREIRKLEQHTNLHIPIVAMTAHALKGDKEKCLEAGMDDYLSKPIDKNCLIEMLERWLEHTTLQQQAVSSKKKASTSLIGTSMIDTKRIKDIFGNDKEAIKQFMAFFVVSTAELLDEILPVIREKNTAPAKELFHRLVGSCGDSGITYMYKLSIKAEEKILTGEWEEVDKLYAELNDAFSRLKAEIKEKFN